MLGCLRQTQKSLTQFGNDYQNKFYWVLTPGLNRYILVIILTTAHPETLQFKSVQPRQSIPSLDAAETKAWSILSATSVKNKSSLAKADTWGVYIFGQKFYASIPFGSRFELDYCKVVNQMGEG